MKDTRSLLLALLAVGLVATWVYHIYDKASYGRRYSVQEAAIDSAAIASEVRDSLEKEYSKAIINFDAQLDSTITTVDSLQTQLTQKIDEINRLKGEIRHILKSPATTSSQLREARTKMAELEERIDELRNDNSSMEAEKLSLNSRLDQMTGEVSSLEKNMRRLDEENRLLKEKIRQASVFVASALHLAAIEAKGEKERETTQVKKADKFVTSFILQNNFDSFLSADVYVVVVEPDGTVLQNSAWESGTFNTRKGERKNYTRHIKFDYEKGEQKQLIFSLNTDRFQKGRYTLQVWQDGGLIGESYKTLN